jgi:signal transduction histidine kinase
MAEFPRRRWPFFAIAALGLAIGLWGMRGLLTLSEPPPGYPTNPILYPARLGPAVVGSAPELRFIAQSRPAGSILEIRSDAGVVRAHLEPQISKFHLGMILLEGLALLAVSFLVFAPRAERGPMRDLFWCTLLYGVATMLHGLYFPQSRSWTDWLLPEVRIVCLTALPVFFFRMTQTFPRPRKLLDLHPRLMRALWIGAGLLAVWQVAAAFRYFVDPRPEVWRGLALPRAIAGWFLAGSFGLGSLTLYRSGRKLELTREREQVKWLLWGFTIGALPYVLLRTLPRLLDITSGIPPELDRLCELAIPIALACAVLRHRFLDVDIIIRRSVIYGTLIAALASVYLLVGVAPAKWIAEHAAKYAVFWQILAVGLPVVLYTPLRRWIGSWVDRTFYKTQHDYARALLGFQDAVRGAASQEEIAELSRHFVGEQLQAERTMVLARRGDSLLTAGELEGVDPEELIPPDVANGGSRRLLAAPNSTSRPDLESADFPAALAGAGFNLAVPLSVEGRSLGAILAGEKKSERRFTEEDLKLLYAVRSEVESALDRVEMVQRAAGATFTRASVEVGEAEPRRRAFARRSRVDLLPLVQDAVAAVSPAARARSVQFELNVAPDVRAVRGDREQLLEMVTTLLENAARHSPDGQAIDITLDRNEEGQMLIVCTLPAWRDS